MELSHASSESWKSALKLFNMTNLAQCYVYEQMTAQERLSFRMAQYNYILATQATRAQMNLSLQCRSSVITNTDSSQPLDLTVKSHSAPTSPTRSYSPEKSMLSPRSAHNLQRPTQSMAEAPLDLSLTLNRFTGNVDDAQKHLLTELGLQRITQQQAELSLSPTEEWKPSLLSENHSLSNRTTNSVSPKDGKSDQQMDYESSSPDTTALHCRVCDLHFTEASCFKKHMSQHTSKSYSCYMCGRSYKQARDYRAHVATHTNGSIFKCDICTCVLTTPSDYLLHLKTHRQKDLLCCTHCGRYFRDSCTLATHMRTHTGEKPYKCDICGKQFRQSGTYRRHRKVHKEPVTRSNTL